MKTSKILVSFILIMLLITGSSFGANEEKRVSLGFLYGWTDIGLVDRTNGAINQVSPTCLDLNSKGELVVTSNLTHTFVNAMHERGIKVTPFLSNHWARGKAVKALENPEQLASSIMNVIYEYDLDGVNVDLENLNEDYREALSNFVIILNSMMPEEKILSVSVAANPKAKDFGWQGSYDYKTLGDNSDYLLLMAYDEHSQGGPEGPVASRNFVEESVVYALNYVSKDKIVLGIPLFGRYWEYNPIDDSFRGGKPVVMGAIPNLYEKLSGDNMYNELVGESRYIFNVDNNVQPVTINGEELADGIYIIWYQGHEGIKDKLDIVNRYNLLGSGVWALGQEKVDVWEYYDAELNKTPYIPYESPITMNVDINYEKITVDLTPINDAINSDKKKMNIIDELDIIDAIEEDIRYDEELEPHLKNEVSNDADYNKTKEMLVEKKKKIRNFSSGKIRMYHRFRMEKTY